MSINNNIPKILIAGPNPAWQKTLMFNNFIQGEVNRAHSMREFASGKGINSARAIATWHQAQSTVLQFAGGENGARLTARLQADDIDNVVIRTAANTRCCTTCLSENGEMTEIIEPAGTPSEEEINCYIAKFAELVPQYDGIIICGTAPGNSSRQLYHKMAEVDIMNKPLLVDAPEFARPLLESGKAYALKINMSEAQRLTGKGDAGEALAAIPELGVPVAGITDGPNPAWLFANGRRWRYTLPELDKVVSPLGSGDTASGIFFSELLRNTPPEEAFKFALAAAQANCLSFFCGHFSIADAAVIYSKITMEEC